MKLFSLTLMSVFGCFLNSCDAIDYKVIVETGSKEEVGRDPDTGVAKLACIEGVGTEGKVYITLYGDKGNSSKIRLDNEGKRAFKPCTVDIFDIKTEDIGLLSKIRVELDNTELINNDNWLLREVSVLDETRQIEATFFRNGWLNTTAGRKTVSAEINRYRGSPLSEYNIFKVIVETGNAKDAGTNCSVYIALRDTTFQSFSYSNLFDLDYTGKLQFQRGQTDAFYIATEYDVGIVSKIRIELDCTGLSKNDNWFLKKISIQDITRRLEKWGAYNKWLTPDADRKWISDKISLINKKGKKS